MEKNQPSKNVWYIAYVKSNKNKTVTEASLTLPHQNFQSHWNFRGVKCVSLVLLRCTTLRVCYCRRFTLLTRRREETPHFTAKYMCTRVLDNFSAREGIQADFLCGWLMEPYKTLILVCSRVMSLTTEYGLSSSKPTNIY